MDPKDDKVELDEESLDEQMKKEGETEKQEEQEEQITTEEKAIIAEDKPIELAPDAKSGGGGKKLIMALLVFFALIGVLFIGLVVKEIIAPSEEEKKDDDEEVVETIGIEVSDMATTYFISDGEAYISSDKFSSDSLQIFVTGEISTEEVGEEVLISWYLEEEGLLVSSELELSDSNMNFWGGANLPEGGWPVGNHYVTVEYQDEEIGRADFSVVVDSELPLKHFTSMGMGVYFQYPNNWKYEYAGQREVHLHPPGEELTNIFVEKMVLADEGLESISEFYTILAQELNEIEANIIDEEQAVFESLGQEYNYFYFRVQVDEGDEEEELLEETMLYLIEIDDESIYVIFYAAPVDQFDKYLEDFNLIVQNFEIIE